MAWFLFGSIYLGIICSDSYMILALGDTNTGERDAT